MPEVYTAKKEAHKPPEYARKPHTPNVTRHKYLPLHERKKLPGHTTSPIASFCYLPNGVEFVAADSKEKIILLLRRHPITNLGWIVLSILLFSAPLVLGVFGLFAVVPAKYLAIGLIFWYCLSFTFTFEKFLGWFFHVNIVTDERIFDVDFHNLVYREITDANIDQIQDVTVQVGSVIRTMFDFGDIRIQTAAQIPQINFEAVPSPDRVAEVLRELRIEEEIEKIEGRVR